MIETKLILVEGVAGSGKSSTAQIIYSSLKKGGVDVTKYHEFSSPHPIFNSEFKDHKSWIESTLAHWNQLVDSLINSNKVVILDSAFIQNSIEDLICSNIDKKLIIDYILKIEKIILSLNPTLIYLYQKDPVAEIKKIAAQRESQWREKVSNYFESTKFGRSRDLKGFDAYLAFIHNFRDISDRIYSKLKIGKLSIENSDGKKIEGSDTIWFRYYVRSQKFWA